MQEPRICQIFLERDRFLDTNIELDNINLPERVNKNHVIDAHGRRRVYLCKTTNLFIGNGRLDEDKHLRRLSTYTI